MSNTAAHQQFYLPPIHKRAWYRLLGLRGKGKHPEYTVPPEPYVDTIAILVGAKLDTLDRLRILFGAKIEFQVFIDTKQVTSNDRRIRHSMILKP